MPFAIHFTWTTYGTWLPGDARGYVAHTLPAEGGWLPRENTPGTPYAKDDAHTRDHAKSLMKDTAVWLNKIQARVAAISLIEVAKTNGWRIVHGAIMANHLHLVMMDCPTNGPAVRRVLKGNSQARLSDAEGRNRRWWTAGGSDRYKNDERAVAAALKYVEEQDHILIAIRDNAIVEVEALPPG